MTTDILNLPKWDVIELEEGHDEYTITARYTVQPTVCPTCGVMFPRLHRYGTKQQPFRDLPIHGKKVRLLVQKKRWKCLECEHIFLEQLDDLDDHHTLFRIAIHSSHSPRPTTGGFSRVRKSRLHGNYYEFHASIFYPIDNSVEICIMTDR